MARPSKLNAPVQERILTAVRAGCTFEVAAQSAGVDRATFYRWKARGEHEQRGIYRDLCDALKKAEADGEVHLVALIRQEAAHTWQAAAWLLERTRPERYGRRDRLDLEVRRQYERVAGPLDLDTDELIAIADRIARGEDERED
ncbi:MAG TPA: hypothetical protein VMS54_13315 [Vicinamibacterales bacterium]|nr:hypothetical protein [Vicinamibacterales bacterium]